jgi:hypothetical protein
LDTKELVSLIVAGAVALVWAVLEIKRWKAGRKAKKIEEENDLMPNPTRCTDHETRLRDVEAVCHRIEPRLTGIETGLGDVKVNVQRLIDLHLEK